MRYLLDANTYIQAKNHYYGMDVCPAYWDWLDLQYESGILASIDFIRRELKDGDDELAKWVSDRPEHFIDNDDLDTQNIIRLIAQNVMAGDYNHANRDNFLDKADPWIIAKAKSMGATVVTQESLVGPDSKKVKVPNICQLLDVPYINTFQLLRNLEARIVINV